MKEIQSLIHKYYDLNKIYVNLLQEKITYEDQIKISEFYNYLIKSKIFDLVIKNNLTTNKTLEYENLTSAFINLLQNNLLFYSNNIDMLNNININLICKLEEEKHDYEIEEQSKLIVYYREKFNDANKALEATAFSNIPYQEKIARETIYKNAKGDFNSEGEILKDLYSKKQYIIEQNWKHNFNHFKKIYNITNSLFIELNEIIKPYFDKGFIYSIYLICDGVVFKNSSEEHYQYTFNSLTNIVSLKKKNHFLFCYLIFFLSQKIQNFDSDEWVSKILLRYNISKEEYIKRRKKVLSNVNDNIKDPESLLNKNSIDFYHQLQSLR